MRFPRHPHHRGTDLTAARRLADFETSLYVSELADATIRNYLSYATRWCDHATGVGHDPTAPTGPLLRAWGDTLPPGVSTRDMARAAMRRWCTAHDTDPALARAIARPQGNTRTVGRQLTRPEARALLAAADRAGTRGHAVYLGLFAGMRISEIAGCRWSYFHPREGLLRFWRDKDDRFHEVALHPILEERFGPYLDGADDPVGVDWCFPNGSGNGGHLVAGTLRRSIRAMCVDAGLPVTGRNKVTTHALRRTAGRAVYEAAHFDLTVPQRFLGHAKLDTTQRYIAATVDVTRPHVAAMGYEDAA